MNLQGTGIKLVSAIFLVAAGLALYYFFGGRKDAIETRAVVLGEKDDSWTVSISNPGKNRGIEAYSAYDDKLIIGGIFERNGFTLFKTSDGEKWEDLVRIDGQPIINLNFFDRDRAVMILTDNSSGRSRTIMMTENGGRDWKTVYSAKNVLFGSMETGAAGTGIIIGDANVGAIPPSYTALILLTRDYGKTWTDISGKLTSLLIVEKDKRPETLSGIYHETGSTFVTLTSLGRIFKTSDLGDSWTLAPNSPEGILRGYPARFGKFEEDGGMWVTEGAISIEDKFAAISSRGPNSGWERYRLDNYYFYEVSSVSGNELVASGVRLTGSAVTNSTGSKQGVILYSKNRGKEWSIIYQDDKTSQLGSIYKLSPARLFVIGQEGNIISLTRRSSE